ncbi:12967_t:CDS:2 [Funneliformis mosseae]|uniref:12967_t:CDS:1 n=1 Tax=Funneliformis mosseae TaxID=27381 RepID=A0A9N9D198_FUNMO|nr:12967_t:CDS:2 [Funneliformis mosseae]
MKKIIWKPEIISLFNLKILGRDWNQSKFRSHVDNTGMEHSIYH